MKPTNSVLKENLLALIIAFILAFSIAFIISKVNFLKADIMGAKNQQSQFTNVDFEVKKDSKSFKVIADKNFEGVQNIIFDILFDPQRVEIKDDNILADDYSMTQIDTGHIEIIVNNLWKIEKWQEVLKLENIDWNYVNLGGIQILFTDGSLQSAFQIKINR